MKTSAEQKSVPKLFSLYPKHLECIKHMVKDRGMTSEADAVRQAIIGYHDKLYPNYIFSLTPAAKDKKNKQATVEAWQNLSGADYARSLNMLVLPNKAGKEVVLLHQISGMVRGVPADGFKEWCKTHKADLATHADKVKETSVESMLAIAGIRTYLQQEYNMDLSAYAPAATT